MVRLGKGGVTGQRTLPDLLSFALWSSGISGRANSVILMGTACRSKVRGLRTTYPGSQTDLAARWQFRCRCSTLKDMSSTDLPRDACKPFQTLNPRKPCWQRLSIIHTPRQALQSIDAAYASRARSAALHRSTALQAANQWYNGRVYMFPRGISDSLAKPWTPSPSAIHPSLQRFKQEMSPDIHCAAEAYDIQ